MCELILRAHQLSQASLSTNHVESNGASGGAGARASRVWQTPTTTRNVATALADQSRFRTRLVLLGTAGGPVWWPGSSRQGISSIVAVGDAIYLVDCGEGWGRMYRNANLGNDGDFQTLRELRAVFLTHLHSDHSIDYPNLLMHGLYNGLPNRQKPVNIYGPGRRGALPPLFGSSPYAPAVMNPMNPTPGIVDMTESLLQAYAADLNDRMRDNRLPDVRSLIEVTDIRLPAHLANDPNGRPSPPMDPLEVYEDENVRVTCTLVDHAPVFPAFGFRFDTSDGSIVFSGDTGSKGSPNLIRLAKGADILVHEVIDERWVRGLYPEPHTPEQESFVHHLLASHTEIREVGKIAEDAGVKTLVLSHLVPGNNPEDRWRSAGDGFSGKLVIGQDLATLGVGFRTR